MKKKNELANPDGKRVRKWSTYRVILVPDVEALSVALQTEHQAADHELLELVFVFERIQIRDEFTEAVHNVCVGLIAQYNQLVQGECWRISKWNSK